VPLVHIRDDLEVRAIHAEGYCISRMRFARTPIISTLGSSTGLNQINQDIICQQQPAPCQAQMIVSNLQQP
jgi:hypothetical protein